ncbi:hypothetical protein [Pararhizobium haloflavum]|uniref:hypothetical protein n=1 Tax=Pararhizobium haloflavum TaxID=2037914 RepID=UPI0012FFFDCA|nr:hypothetical protein [Pararhizobium haloflavum]
MTYVKDVVGLVAFIVAISAAAYFFSAKQTDNQIADNAPVVSDQQAADSNGG